MQLTKGHSVYARALFGHACGGLCPDMHNAAAASDTAWPPWPLMPGTRASDLEGFLPFAELTFKHL